MPWLQSFPEGGGRGVFVVGRIGPPVEASVKASVGRRLRRPRCRRRIIVEFSPPVELIVELV